ncbi:E3 ubiquitin-protein ligase listerin [Schizosaccharomyces pombe 972h-] [Rhizoctonia solani]|uniref:E3 ubiquitin-protein ligase listerin [Schizosaccharomyces pombe 972h-] n=1 Tax=Rhizoctonia solani TaxID=456999 RepID=A0A0K6FNV2_9AGAM|nr:E3 ubiquitin-protein ligase listerin [Schizosaccharomyces pombe 972h-] [Rhizoctonia solani]
MSTIPIYTTSACKSLNYFPKTDDHHQPMSTPPAAPLKRRRRSLCDANGSPTYAVKAPSVNDWSSSLRNLCDTFYTAFEDFAKVPQSKKLPPEILEGYGELRLTLSCLIANVDEACHRITAHYPHLANQTRMKDASAQTDDLPSPTSEAPPPPPANKEHYPLPTSPTYASVASARTPRRTRPRLLPSTSNAKPTAVKPLNPVHIVVQLKRDLTPPIRNLPAREVFCRLTESCAKLPNAPIPLGAQWNRKNNLIVSFPAGTTRTAIKLLYPSIHSLVGSVDKPVIRFDVPWRKVHLAGILARESPDLPITSEAELRHTLLLNPALQALNITVQPTWLKKPESITGTHTSAIIAFEDPDGSIERALLKSTIFAFGETVTVKKWHDQLPANITVVTFPPLCYVCPVSSYLVVLVSYLRPSVLRFTVIVVTSYHRAWPQSVVEYMEWKKKKVVELLKKIELDFGEFVWAVCFGNHASRACKKMQAARSSFIKGNYLVPLLENIRVPPRTEAKGKRPDSAKDTLDRFALATMCSTFQRELTSYGSIPPVHIRDFIDPERLGAMSYAKLKKQVEDHCPTLFKVLHYLSSFNRQKRSLGNANTKNSEFFVVMQVSGISYEISQVNNNFQKLLSIYFSGAHVPKPVIELLNRCNICMSYSWTNDNIDKLSDEITAKMIEVALNQPFFLSHDNIQIVFGVGSQRGYRKSIADNGTAITMYVLPEAARAIFENPEVNNALRLKLHNLRRQGLAPALTWPELNDRQRRSRVFNHRLYHLFDILRHIPGLEKCEVLSDPLLQHPGSWHTLPAGLEHCIKMYMLATQNLDESTYAGNLQVIDTVLRLLKLDRGDPLVRGADKHNGTVKENGMAVIAWIHSFSSLGGFMPKCVFVLSLGRKGFAENMRTTRPDYHTVVELLIHEFNARVRGLWMWGAGVSTLEELVSWIKDPSRTPQEILDLGKRIQSERISSQAVSECRQTMDQHKDEVFLSTLITNRDLMMHYDLHHAVKHGHVGEMEDMIPELLVYFTGAGSKNYAREMYEMLQMLYHETTPEMRTAIRTYGFLVNKYGRKDSFYPIDKRQEFNNGGIRRHGPPPHGGADWERYAKISPVIPVYMDVTEQVEQSVSSS